MEKEKFGKIETEQRNSYQILTEKLLSFDKMWKRENFKPVLPHRSK